MAYSSLVNYIKISPNSSARTEKVSKITVHHMAGKLSVEACGDVFATSARQASSNYGIGYDARVGLYVDESRRSWASSSNWNDQRAITIEVSNSSIGGNWPVSTECWNKLVELCVDICRRYNFRLNYTGDKNGSLTEHRMYAATTCPGPYLHDRMTQLANEVNNILDNGTKQDMSNAGFASIDNQAYTGSEIKPQPVSAANATFTSTYENNINVGWGKVICTGTDKWEGRVELPFKILPQALVGYQDIDPSAWYVDNLDTAVQRGYISGYSPSQMAPDAALTRANAVCIIANAAGFKAPDGFKDVPQPVYYYDALSWAKEQGIVQGSGGQFRPEDNCTRTEFIQMLYNWKGTETDDNTVQSFSDWNEVPEWGQTGIRWAVANNILSGSDGKIYPNNSCTRAEGITFLIRLMDL